MLHRKKKKDKEQKKKKNAMKEREFRHSFADLTGVCVYTTLVYSTLEFSWAVTHEIDPSPRKSETPHLFPTLGKDFHPNLQPTA